MKISTKKFWIMASAIVLGSCATDSAPPPPAPLPPPPPVAPPSFIPTNAPMSEYVRSLYNSAGLLPQFAEEAKRAAEPISYASAAAIAASVDKSPLLARTETIDGAKAYAIIAAAQSQEFRDGIKQIGEPMTKAGFINALISNPAFVRTIPGYENAKSLASSAITNNTSMISRAAATLHQAAYDLQRQNWAKTIVPKEPRLAAMATSWETPIAITNFDPSNVSTNGAATQEINDRIMAAAALYIIRADQAMSDMMQLGSGRSCAYRAYLNTRMCMAATRFPFEHSFCISQHAQDEFKQCVSSEVGYPPPPPPPVVRPPPPPPKAKVKAPAKKKKR